MRLQLRALCEHLAVRHEVCVVAFRWPDQDGAGPDGAELHTVVPPIPGVIGRTRDRAASLVRRTPVDVIRLAPPMVGALRSVLAQRRFDVAHVTMGALTGVAPALGSVPAVIAPLDAWSLNLATGVGEAAGVRRAWLRLTGRIVARHEARAYRPFARVVLVTPEDARETRRLDPTLRTAVIPNGVDAEHF